MGRITLGARMAASWLNSGDSHGQNWVLPPGQVVHKVQDLLSPALVCSRELDSPNKCRSRAATETVLRCLAGRRVLSQVTSFSARTWLFQKIPAFSLLFSLSSPVCGGSRKFLEFSFYSHSSTMQSWEGLIKDLTAQNGGKQLCGIFITAWQS